MYEYGLTERYVNFHTDFAFKKFFGTEANKDLLISFLNSPQRKNLRETF